MYVNNQKGKIYRYVSAISVSVGRRTAMVLITAVSASVTSCCIKRQETKESKSLSKTTISGELIIRSLAQTFGEIPPIITVSADQI